MWCNCQVEVVWIRVRVGVVVVVLILIKVGLVGSDLRIGLLADGGETSGAILDGGDSGTHRFM